MDSADEAAAATILVDLPKACKPLFHEVNKLMNLTRTKKEWREINERVSIMKLEQA